jgi:arginase
MAVIELVGVPFDGYGRVGHQAAAAMALHRAGLVESFSSHQIVRDEDLSLPEPDPGRGSSTSLINESALLAMARRVGERASGAVALNRFPFVYGGDCTTLLGTIPALRSTEAIGLLFVDGHEDTMPLDVSEDGEAANTEIGLLLGLTGRLLSGPLADRLPALRHDELAVLGPRDERWRQRFNVGTLRDTGVWFRDWRQTNADPVRQARAAVEHLRRTTGRWWLHVDLDVLDPEEFAAQGVPGGDDEPDGLTWSALTELLTAAIDEGGCVGWSVAIYDPEQDPSGSDAERIVQLVADVAAALA